MSILGMNDDCISVVANNMPYIWQIAFKNTCKRIYNIVQTDVEDLILKHLDGDILDKIKETNSFISGSFAINLAYGFEFEHKDIDVFTTKCDLGLYAYPSHLGDFLYKKFGGEYEYKGNHVRQYGKIKTITLKDPFNGMKQFDISVCSTIYMNGKILFKCIDDMWNRIGRLNYGSEFEQVYWNHGEITHKIIRKIFKYQGRGFKIFLHNCEIPKRLLKDVVTSIYHHKSQYVGELFKKETLDLEKLRHAAEGHYEKWSGYCGRFVKLC